MSVGLVLGGRYQLRSSLGQGGFGTVWRAHDRTLGRDVAIKLINMDSIGAGDREEVSHRFFREARAVAGLNHPNVVTAHDYGVQDETAYLVMELITGGSLEDEMRAKAGPVAIERAVAVGTQVCAGLSAAHSAGLVHRDLKPANIMNATGSDLVKIVDFGIARVADQSKITHTGSYLGTLRYTSPEQMGAGMVDARADLYSLGCVLFELMAGRSPYEARTPVQWIAAHQYQVPAKLSAFVPDVPPALLTLVDKLLAKSPSGRPVNAEAVRTALLDIQAQLQAGTRTGRAAAISPSGTPTRSPVAIGLTPVDPAVSDSGPRPPVSPYPGSVNPYPYQSAGPQPYAVAGRMPYTAPGWPAIGSPQVPAYLGPPPPHVTIGAWLLRGSGVLAVLLAVLSGAAYSGIEHAWVHAYGQIAHPGSDTTEGGVIVYCVLAVAQAVLALVLSRGLVRGSYAGRVLVICFVGLVDIGCCVAGALTVDIEQPTSADLSTGLPQQAVDGANNDFRLEFPHWFSAASAVICVAGALLLMITLILVVTPASNAYFRAGRGRIRMAAPMQIRLPGV